MRRAYVDAAAVVVVTVAGSLLANAYTQTQQDETTAEICEALLATELGAELSPEDCPD